MYRVSYSTFKAALLSRGKNDRRPYMNAFRLDSEGLIISTDGHRLFCGKAETESTESVTVEVLGKEPSRFDYAEINATLANFYSDENGLLCSLPARVIDQNYPDWRRVVKFNEGSVSQIGFTAKYLTDLSKMAKFYNLQIIKIEFQDNTNACRVKLSETDYVVLMPARVK